MKYNDPLIIRENESLSILLKHINVGSTILEFGCANGRMTQYMSEALSCHVFIVEYEKKAYNDAMRYAEKGICDDIMSYTWLDTFKDYRFDYIIFADVLEHLYSPQEVLSNTRKLLKDNGMVLISVPNVCHNDVIARLYMNSFVYTDVGLLDDTHIRFFSEKTLGSFCKGAGYRIVDRDFVTLESGTTEQLRCCKDRVDSLLWNMLLSRENGNVYQYILILKKESYETKENELDENIIIDNKKVLPKKDGVLYFDRGNGFTEEDKEIVFATGAQDGGYVYESSLFSKEMLSQMRYDPCENQSCIVEEIVISEPDKINVNFSNCIKINNSILLLGNDPQIIFKPKNLEFDELKIKIKFYTWGKIYLQLIEKMLLTCNNEKILSENLFTEKIRIMQNKYLDKIDNKEILINELVKCNKDKEEEMCIIKDELNSILKSKSWRWTKLFRSLKNMSKNY